MFKSNVYFESKQKAIELVVEKGLYNIILESDLLQIISAIREVEFFLTLVIEASAFHIRCQANSVAHHLARFALHFDGDCAWIDNPPSIISDLKRSKFSNIEYCF